MLHPKATSSILQSRGKEDNHFTKLKRGGKRGGGGGGAPNMWFRDAVM